jgi:hypothetical protein
MLWEMTFAQLLSMIETRNERERKAHEEAERRAAEAEANPGFAQRPKPGKDFTKGEALPSTSDISRVFGGMMG